MTIKSGDTVPIEALARLTRDATTRLLLDQISAAWPDRPLPTLEYHFARPRRFRFDLCWIAEKVGLEIDGGTWLPGGGRHNRGKGFIKDMEKLNKAAALGWRVVRVTPDQVRNGTALNELRGVLSLDALDDGDGE